MHRDYLDNKNKNQLSKTSIFKRKTSKYFKLKPIVLSAKYAVRSAHLKLLIIYNNIDNIIDKHVLILPKI